MDGSVIMHTLLTALQGFIRMDLYSLDGYKYSHYLMDDEGLEYKSFYIEARTEDMEVGMA